MKNLSFFLLLFVAVIFNACQATNHGQQSCATWKIIYRNDKDGNTISGNKNDLLNAARRGYPIRIGFGSRRVSDTTKSVEHITDASFLTITNDNELFAQITPIIGQNPNLDQDSLGVVFRENLSWTIVVGTTGFSDRLMIDRFQDTVVGHRNLSTSVSWFVNLPIEEMKGDADYLYSK
ncbi:MAG: hypothetical protein AAF806_14265 [Bacteroidota bacterium]